MATHSYSATNLMSVTIYERPQTFLNFPPTTANDRFINRTSDKCHGDVQLEVGVRRHWTTDFVEHSGISNSTTQSLFVKTFLLTKYCFGKLLDLKIQAIRNLLI